MWEKHSSPDRVITIMKKTLTVLLGLSMALGSATLSMAKDKPASGQSAEAGKKSHKGKDKTKHHRGDKGNKKNPDGATAPTQP